MDIVTNEELALQMINGDSFAKELLAERNMGLVHHLANKFKSSGVPYEELYSQCLFGLTKAINTFNPEKAVKFATYAAKIMTNDILMYFRKRKKYQGDISIDSEIANDDGNSLTILDTLADKSGESEYDMAEILELLDEVLKEEPERNKLIIHLFLKEEKKQHEIAEELKLSQSYISRLIVRVLNKLKVKAYQTGLLAVNPYTEERKVKQPKEVKKSMNKRQSPGNPAEFTEEKYIELRAQKLTNKQISKLYGRSEAWVHAKKKDWEEAKPEADRDVGPTKEAYNTLLGEKKELEQTVRNLESMNQSNYDIEASTNNDLLKELETVKNERDQLYMLIGKIVYQNQLFQVS